MKVLLQLVVGILALIGALAIGVLILGRLENPKSQFATYAELKDSGLMERGWLPAFLPSSIHDITEQHDIDTNHVWADFRYDPSDISAFAANCTSLVTSPSGSKYLCPPYDRETTIVILRADGSATLTSTPHEI
jgi:hypothetical protein